MRPVMCRRLLLLGLGSIAGQLAGSPLFNGVIPGTATTLRAGTVGRYRAGIGGCRDRRDPGPHHC